MPVRGSAALPLSLLPVASLSGGGGDALLADLGPSDLGPSGFSADSEDACFDAGASTLGAVDGSCGAVAASLAVFVGEAGVAALADAGGLRSPGVVAAAACSALGFGVE